MSSHVPQVVNLDLCVCKVLPIRMVVRDFRSLPCRDRAVKLRQPVLEVLVRLCGHLIFPTSQYGGAARVMLTRANPW